MKHLQKLLLLSLLLVTCSSATAYRSWTRLEGRDEAKSHFTASLAYLQGRNNHSCGGFLVAPGWVMTAAQCSKYKPLTVTLEAHTSKEGSWQTFEVQEYHCHPNFTKPEAGNDILLLKLQGNATSNSYLPLEEKPRRVSKCSMLGWEHRAHSATLRKATVTVISNRDCMSYFPGRAKNLLCGRSGSAGVPGKSDAGDPLICNNKAFGIFSYKYGTWPGFYTLIAPYLSWVESVMKSV
ncbi:granzyme B-like [Pogoniulus pusillus]|uniref:granzyme B-like n=1 Tax=Pogoniulus pusillus TaxID=488313 RepID=UPI0030B938C8